MASAQDLKGEGGVWAGDQVLSGLRVECTVPVALCQVGCRDGQKPCKEFGLDIRPVGSHRRMNWESQV